MLSQWGTFFTLTGGAAATLTGLMFVVITLIRREDFDKADENAIQTFSTPTVMHFGSALLLSAILTAPWHGLAGPGVLVALFALACIIHMMTVVWRVRHLTQYAPDLDDLNWYTVLPLLAYCVAFVSAIIVIFWPPALFGMAGAALLLTFIGIRNAWDVVTFLAMGGSSDNKDAKP